LSNDLFFLRWTCMQKHSPNTTLLWIHSESEALFWKCSLIIIFDIYSTEWFNLHCFLWNSPGHSICTWDIRSSWHSNWRSHKSWFVLCIRLKKGSLVCYLLYDDIYSIDLSSSLPEFLKMMSWFVVLVFCSGNSGGPAFNEQGECIGVAFQVLLLGHITGTWTGDLWFWT
jgi:hypothetical protein